MIYLCDLGFFYFPIAIYEQKARIGTHYIEQVATYNTQKLYKAGEYSINFDTNSTTIVIYKKGKMIQGACHKAQTY